MSQDKMKSRNTLIADKVVEEARGWLEVRFRHQGRNRAGIDCAGLCVVIAHALGLSEFDTANYGRAPKNDTFIGHFRNNMTQKNRLDRKPGDVLLFRDDMFTCHSAIYDIVNGQEVIIHAYALRRKVVEEDFTEEWLSKLTHCFAYHGVE